MSALVTARPLTQFDIPASSVAIEPPEYRGIPRDEVRLLASIRGVMCSYRFRDLPDLLDPGDLLVVNTSPTLPAAFDGEIEGRGLRPVHVSTPLPDGEWIVEIRLPDNTGPDRDLVAGTVVLGPGRRTFQLREPYPDPSVSGTRLWRACVSRGLAHAAYLRRYGRPISYGYQSRQFPLRDYQTVYAIDADHEPVGSAEMASAGRPFSSDLLIRVMTRGIAVAPIVLHAGVASPESHEPPMPERFAVPEFTARMVQTTRAHGGRVVAVGTTVVRALETAALPDGHVMPAQGWTNLIMGPQRAPRAVSGLISGLHEPEASHLLLLEAVVGPELVARAYATVVAERYLWHEFGDSMLLLPE